MSTRNDDASLEQTALVASVPPRNDHSTAQGVLHRSRKRRRRNTGPRLCVGAIVGGTYMVEGTLGAGGCGEVYAARHIASGRRVAIKVLRAEMAHVPNAVPRFIREVEALGRISHEAIVEVYDAGELFPGVPYYVMELLEGMNLRQLLAIHRRFSAREALALLEPVVAALHCVHEQGIIHRDVKASNVFVSEHGGRRAVKLLDFGTAKLLYGEHGVEGLTAPGTTLGTPHAMAPEQIRCERLDHRADIYSLGVLTFLLVTGAYPFADPDQRRLALLHLQAPPPRPSASSAVPAAVDEVVLRCMEKDPRSRYATALEFIDALRRAVGAEAGEQRAAPGRLAPAVGIRLDVGTVHEQELDDDVIEDISGVLDLVEDELAGHDFAFPLRASNTLTAVRLVEPADREPFSLDQAQALLETLRATLEHRDSAHPGVRVSLSVRQDAVECRTSQDGVEYVGGPLLDVDTWTGSW